MSIFSFSPFRVQACIVLQATCCMIPASLWEHLLSFFLFCCWNMLKLSSLRMLCLGSLVLCFASSSLLLWLVEIHPLPGPGEGASGPARAPVVDSPVQLAKGGFLQVKEPEELANDRHKVVLNGVEWEKDAADEEKLREQMAAHVLATPAPSETHSAATPTPPAPRPSPKSLPPESSTAAAPKPAPSPKAVVDSGAQWGSLSLPRHWLRERSSVWGVAAPEGDPNELHELDAAESVAKGWWTAASSALDHSLPSREEHMDQECWSHYDFGMLDAWGAAAKDVCAGAPPSAVGKAASVRCRERELKNVPAPTRPHVVCDASWVQLDFSLSSPAKCPRFRPHYKCDGPPFFQAYAPGFQKAACSLTAAAAPGNFPRDHLRDIFASLQGVGPGDPMEIAEQGATQSWGCADGPEVDERQPCKRENPRSVLLVTRERGEFANLFHVLTDFLNAFFALHLAGVVDGYDVGSREGMQGVGVVLLDEQPQGPFDEAWTRVFSPVFGVRRPSAFRAAIDPKHAQLLHKQHPQLRAGSDRGDGQHVSASAEAGVGHPQAMDPSALPTAHALLSEHTVFAAPGYSNFLLAHLDGPSTCARKSRLLRAFREFFLGGMGVPTPAARSNERLRVVVVSRRPYDKFVGHAFVGRQVDNEQELMEAFQASGGADAFLAAGADVKLVDLVHLDFAEQLELIASTDILVGMHGAALSYAAFLPPWAGVLELWPKTTKMWRCFEHLAHLSGVAYQRWANPDKSRYREDKQGDYTTLDVPAVVQLAKTLATAVREERRNLGLA